VIHPALLLSALLAAAPAKEAPVLRFGTDVTGTHTLDPGSGDDPKPLKVGAPVVKVEGGKVLGELVVENPTEKPIRVVVSPYGGAFPYGGASPFTLGLGGEPAVKYTGQLFPPAPPRPMVIEFPARSKVLFPAEIALANYTWAGELEATLVWGFYFSKAPPVEGKIRVRLPRK